MDEPIQLAECLLAVLGVPRLMETTPKPATEAEVNRASKVWEAIPKRWAELLEKPAGKPGSDDELPTLPDYWEVQALMRNTLDADELVHLMVSLPPEVQAVFPLAASSAIAYLQQKFPHRAETTLARNVPREPSAGEWHEFGWLWELAKNPLLVFGRIGCGLLTSVEVDHLQAMFPSLYAEMAGELQIALAERSAQDEEWAPPWWLQKQLCTFLRVSPVSKTLVGDIDQAIQASIAQRKEREAKIVDPEMAALLKPASERLDSKAT